MQTPQNHQSAEIVEFVPKPSLGQKIRESRLARNLSVQTFALRIGMLPQQVETMESGLVRVDYSALLRSAHVLDVLPSVWLQDNGEGPDHEEADHLFAVMRKVLAEQRAKP